MENYLETRKILSYDDVAAYPAPTTQSDEELVAVVQYDSDIRCRYRKFDMLPITGSMIYVRDEVARRIARVEARLKLQGFHLEIAYGYRHPSIQAQYFEKRKDEISRANPELTGAVLDRFVHNFVAIPDIAGHPTGGALDLTLVRLDGSAVDMGTEIADYADDTKIKTDAQGINPEHRAHRTILHDAMVAEGFAPFYGEWWHFSYGDREWSAFYKKAARYGAVEYGAR